MSDGFDHDGMRVSLLRDEDGRVGLRLIPIVCAEAVVTPRADLRGEAAIEKLPPRWRYPAARAVDPLVHVFRSGDRASGGFAQGLTQRWSQTTRELRPRAVEGSGDGLLVSLATDDGLAVDYRIAPAGRALRVDVRLRNDGAAAMAIEHASSFALGGLSPFTVDDDPGRLRVHRFRSAWSVEGRHEARSVEELELERSWSGHAVRCERFGQVGTMPVRGWFPFVAVEDTRAGVTWGARLCWPGSWQMELFRQDDGLAISGGLADRETGHWRKMLEPGAELALPTALLACVAGDIDDCCAVLNDGVEALAVPLPASEHDLPVVFNEWCTTWGAPSAATTLAIADRLRGSGVRYLVIDAGWYCPEGGDWTDSHGDWLPNPTQFPEGLAPVAAAIRERGLIPGLWFEAETLGPKAEAIARPHRLHRDGLPIDSGGRQFWDLREPDSHAWLHERVVQRLRDDGFGYVKIDYNETPGIGCDDAESLGEGLRQHVLGSIAFFQHLRQQLPALVIENCSSGGHRLEPLLMGLTSMSSFSDAHETPEIPLIAGNLHGLVPAHRSQIWAVLHPDDDERRLRYSLAATFLGRMCLSGSIQDLDEEQWHLTCEAIAGYRRAAPVIRDGIARRSGAWSTSLRRLEGHQVVVRRAPAGTLVVAHRFGGADPGTIRVAATGSAQWRFVDAAARITAADDGLAIELPEPWSAAVLLLGDGQSESAVAAS